MSRYGRKGFSLIEILIVIVIIAFLGAILITKLGSVARKAKESVLRDQLDKLRNAIQQFEADCGRYPKTLDELLVKPADMPDVEDVGVDINKSGVVAWQGPYIKTEDGLLKDPFTESSTTWSYTATTGHVQSGSDMYAINGEKYSTW